MLSVRTNNNFAPFCRPKELFHCLLLCEAFLYFYLIPILMAKVYMNEIVNSKKVRLSGITLFIFSKPLRALSQRHFKFPHSWNSLKGI